MTTKPTMRKLEVYSSRGPTTGGTVPSAIAIIVLGITLLGWPWLLV
jgi:hypothetical protein